MAKPHPIPDFDPPLTPEEEAKLAELRRNVDEGIRELDAGLGLDGDSVFAELRARFRTAPDEA